MPIRLHLTLLFLTRIASLLGGFMLGMIAHETIRSSLPGILQVKEVVFIFFGMVPAALALLVTGFVFRSLIAGRCPKCGGRCPKCGGRAIYHASRKEKAILGGSNEVPITYHCKECGHVHRTRVYPASPMDPN